MNRFQDIFDAQKALFATGVTRTYEWRVEQLTHGQLKGAVANSVGICWRGLRLGEDIGSGSEVNQVIGDVLTRSLPSIDASHDDLTGGEQGPEQHGGGLGGGQHGLGFDPTLELLVEPFDGVGGARAFPLAGRQSGKAEEPVPGFLEAVGHRLALEPPFANEGPPALLDLGGRGRVDHIGVVG